MNFNSRSTSLCVIGAGMASLALTGASSAELYLNEIYFDPPGSTGDVLHEYVELRGTPSMSLDNHYLLFLENEGQGGGGGTITGRAGEIDAFFDLNGQSLGANGFLVLRQAAQNASKPNPYVVAPGTADLINTSGFITGWGTTAAPSTIGWNSEDFRTENSGFTAFLIRVDPDAGGAAPILAQDLDTGNDGLDELPTGWSIVDGIGLINESDEAAFGRTYADINFGFGPNTNQEPGAEYVEVDFELEYVARLGDSTGSTAGDWWVGNLTDNLRRPGFENLPDNPPNFRLSAADGLGGDQTGDVESSTDQFDYATLVTNHLGASNPGTPVSVGGVTGDYDDSGQVEQGDLDIVLQNWGTGTFTGNVDNLVGGGPFDGTVDQNELDGVLQNWGSTAAPALNGTVVPEPASGSALVAVACLVSRRRRR